MVADEGLTTVAPNENVLSEQGAAPARTLRADEALPLLAISIGASLVRTDQRIAPADGVGVHLVGSRQPIWLLSVAVEQGPAVGLQIEGLAFQMQIHIFHLAAALQIEVVEQRPVLEVVDRLLGQEALLVGQADVDFRTLV